MWLPSKGCSIKSLRLRHHPRSREPLEPLADEILSSILSSLRSQGRVFWEGGRGRSESSAQAALEGTKVHPRDVSQHSDRDPAVSPPQGCARGHCPARPPEHLLEVTTPEPECLQGSTCGCFVQIHLVFSY